MSQLNQNNISDHTIPTHVAIVMDGNGRWAKKQGLARNKGHKQGTLAIRKTLEEAIEQKIKYLTLFCFSSENWKRPQNEINLLMTLLVQHLSSQSDMMNKHNICLHVIGIIKHLPENVQSALQKSIKQTKNNTGLHVTLAINYGGRQDIVEAARAIARDVREQKTNLESLDEQAFSQYLSSAYMPNPDLLIRTSGEMRISNFLLWELAYAELIFIDKYWPDFEREDFKYAIQTFQNRQRRFGAIDT